MEREEVVRLSGDFLTQIEFVVRLPNTGTKILVEANGKILPFEQVLPQEANLIADIIRLEKPYRLYYFNARRDMSSSRKCLNIVTDLGGLVESKGFHGRREALFNLELF